MGKKLKIVLSALALCLLFTHKIYASESQPASKNYTYLSDISYDKDKSFAASGHSIHLDENDSNQMITLKVNEKVNPISRDFVHGQLQRLFMISKIMIMTILQRILELISASRVHILIPE